MEKLGSSEDQTRTTAVMLLFEFDDKRAFVLQATTDGWPEALRRLNVVWDMSSFSHRHENNRTIPQFALFKTCAPDQIEVTAELGVITMQNMLNEYDLNNVEISRAEQHTIETIETGVTLEDFTVEARMMAMAYNNL